MPEKCNVIPCPFENKIDNIHDAVVGTEEEGYKDGIKSKVSDIDEGLRGGRSNGQKLGLYARVNRLEVWQRWVIFVATGALVAGIIDFIRGL